MLNHHKLVKQLTTSTHDALQAYHQERMRVRDCWQELCTNELLVKEVLDTPTSLPLPRWHTSLSDMSSIVRCPFVYRVVATDGSQIYPDRHQGLPLYVINIGVADFSYEQHEGSVHFDTIPQLFYAHQDESEENPLLIDCQRSELELHEGLRRCQDGKSASFLCDGSLIAWHLSDITQAKKVFFDTYLMLFEQFMTAGIPLIGYVSMPKSRDLIAMVRAALALYNKRDESLCYLVDTDLLFPTLPLYHRTTLFESRVAAVQEYPSALKPHFFYLNVGTEIARIEIPAWIAHDPAKVAWVEQVVIDQVYKGGGYPICLAEAHELAVIKGQDRDIFYHMIREIMQKQGMAYPVSQKSIKKRGIGI